MQDRVFDSPSGVLRDLLHEKNAEIHTYDMSVMSAADGVLFCNHNVQLLRDCLQAGLNREKLSIMLFEPPSVIPGQYSPDVWKSYGRVFTWNDNFVDHKHFFNLRYPQGQTLRTSLLPFAKRKFLIMVNANKYSYVSGEGYSFRRGAVRHFDRHPSFDLFGHGWNDPLQLISAPMRKLIKASLIREKNVFCGNLAKYIADIAAGLSKFNSYRGPISDKYDVMSHYKYALCFENQLDCPGYITEKVFDCLFTGCIPVYLGATNIEERIPTECFIDMRRFASFAQLEDCLESIDEPTFNDMQSAGQDFIRSDRFLKWTPRGVFKQVIDVLA
ncbi:MAG: glycosyltransferase family 10 domain-containing protein [Armatimonadota bacterium]